MSHKTAPAAYSMQMTECSRLVQALIFPITCCERLQAAVCKCLCFLGIIGKDFCPLVIGKLNELA